MISPAGCRVHRQPLTAAVQGVLGPLSKQLSEALQQLLLSPAGRRSVAEGVRELAQSVQARDLAQSRAPRPI